LAQDGGPKLAEWRAAIELRPKRRGDPGESGVVAGDVAGRSLRNGDAAMALAARTSQYSVRKDARVLDIMAAAYAEKGDFEHAESIERDVLAAQGLKNRPELAAQIRSRGRFAGAGKIAAWSSTQLPGACIMFPVPSEELHAAERTRSKRYRDL
jgi:hypothetical protein